MREFNISKQCPEHATWFCECEEPQEIKRRKGKKERSDLPFSIYIYIGAMGLLVCLWAGFWIGMAGRRAGERQQFQREIEAIQSAQAERDRSRLRQIMIDLELAETKARTAKEQIKK